MEVCEGGDTRRDAAECPARRAASGTLRCRPSAASADPMQLLDRLASGPGRLGTHRMSAKCAANLHAAHSPPHDSPVPSAAARAAAPKLGHRAQVLRATLAAPRALPTLYQDHHAAFGR